MARARIPELEARIAELEEQVRTLEGSLEYNRGHARILETRMLVAAQALGFGPKEPVPVELPVPPNALAMAPTVMDGDET